MSEIDKTKVAPTIDARIRVLDAKLRAQGKLQDDGTIVDTGSAVPQTALDASMQPGTVPILPDGCLTDAPECLRVKQ